MNRVAFEFAYAEEVRARHPESSDDRTLAAALTFVALGESFEAASAAAGRRRAPVGDDGDFLLAPATGAVFAVNHGGETTLSVEFEVQGAMPGTNANVLVWSRRGGSGPAVSFSADLEAAPGRRREFRIDSGEGPLEVGFAVSGGEGPEGSGDWLLRVSKPRLVRERQVVENISNVLLVVVDTLRADRVGVYGSELATPNIDRLAARGVTFRKAYSHIPITGPSHASIFTSLIPAEHGVHNNGQIFAPDMSVMAEIFNGAGMNTAGVVSLGVLKGRFGFGRGFEFFGDQFRYDWWKDAAEVNAEVMDLLDGGLPEPFFLWVHYSDPHEPYAPPELDFPRIALELNGEPVGELRAGGRSQVFDIELAPGENRLQFGDAGLPDRRSFHVNTFEVEDPDVELLAAAGWESRERRTSTTVYVTSFPATAILRNTGGERRRVSLRLACSMDAELPELRRLYDLEVEFVDREIGRLLDFMAERDLLANTLVIFASDHGEGLGDHNHLGHISQLYDSALRVPLILAYPGRLPEGAVIDEPVALVDVLPTALDLMAFEGLDRPTGASLVPLILQGETRHRSIVAETHRPEAYSEKRALVQGGFKYIHSWLEDREWEELYDLERDPGELRDLSAIETERLESMRDALRTRLFEAVAADVVEAELSGEEIEKLRALGYVH